MSLRKDVGQLLIAGLSGAGLTDMERAWLRHLSPGGIILFRRNVHAAAQVHALLSNVRVLSDEPLLRAVDVEGGLVDRLRELIAPAPSAAIVGKAVRNTGDTDLAMQHGRLIGRETRLLGFNSTFAPVLDLETLSSAPVMRTRVASADPKTVAAYGAAFLKGLRKEKVLGCGKHFPGLGGGTLDSHLATPTIDRSWDAMWAEDLLPFRKLHRALPIIMISHARYPNATRGGRDKSDQPASVSPFWIERVLRRRIGYKGLVISDDMEMGGILQHASIEDAAVAAIAAGTHMLEICKDPSLIFRAYEALLTEAERSRSFRARVESSARKVRSSKRHLLGRDALPPPPSPQAVAKMREAMEAFSAEVHRLAVSESQEAAAGATA